MCAPLALDDGASGLAFVAAEVVQDEDIARREGRSENLLDVEEEGFAVDRPVDHLRRTNLVVAQRGDEGQGLPMAMGRIGLQPSSPRPPAAQGRHVGLHPGLVDEHKLRGRDPALMGLPSRPLSRHVRARLFLGQQRFFEAQALGVNEHPHRPRMRLDPPFRQLRRQAPQRKRPGGDACPQPVGAIARQRAGLVAADLSRGQRAGLALALRPLGNSRRADSQRRRNLPVRLARLLSGQRPLPKVNRIRSRHPCWPPNPAWTLNQITPDLEIPIPSKRGML